MRIAILLCVAALASIPAFAQENHALDSSATKTNNAVENFNRERTHVQRCELQIEALQAAIKALKAGAGNERYVAALEQLIQAQEQELQTAKVACEKSLAAMRDIEVSAPAATARKPVK